MWIRRRCGVGLWVLGLACEAKRGPDEAASPRVQENAPAEARAGGDAKRGEAAAEAKATSVEGWAWRYAPTLAQAVPSDTVVAPIGEVELRGEGEVWIVVATMGPSEVAPTVALWTFDQQNPKGLLELRSRSPGLLAAPSDGRPGPLVALRRHMAAPSARTLRPRGLGSAPGDLLPSLEAAARTVRDPSADRQRRVDALARFMSGVDDAVAFQAGRVEALMTTLAAGLGTAQELSEQSPRRRTVLVQTITGASMTVQLVRAELGWVVAEASL